MLNLCAGPTTVPEKVKKAMASFLTNPDLDPNYTKVHRKVEEKISQLLHTKSTSFIMLGEGIMGLDSSIASLMEPGERVLVIENGVFGEGFSDYVNRYGGKPVFFHGNPRKGIDTEELKAFLEQDSDFSLATLVHCETPSGITNDISKICPLLKEYGILSIVDSVSGMGGEKIHFDEDKIDVLLGGSQKTLSAPTGLTLVTLSKAAKEKIANRNTLVPGYYLNYQNYYGYEDDTFDFPYTMCENLTCALDAALDIVLEKDFVSLHQKAGDTIRETLKASGLELFAQDHFANTVTTLYAPEEISKDELIRKLYDKNILISGGFGEELKNTFRIAHMGNSIQDEYYEILFQAMDEIFEKRGKTRNLLKHYRHFKREYQLF